MRGYALLLAGLFACGGSSYETRKGVSSTEWVEIRSPHFVVRTDLDRATAEKRVAGFETRLAALTQLYTSLLGRFDPPQEVTQVIIFSSCTRVQAIHDRAVGFVTQTRDFTAERLMVTCQDYRYSENVFTHEIVHLFNHAAFGPLPVWLEEGLAGYLETVDVENGSIIIGRPDVTTQNLHGHPITNMPTLDHVVGADYEHFHSGDQAYVYYIASRNLVGAIATRSDVDHNRFLELLQRLARGQPRADAWQETFGKVSQEELGEDMRLYHTKSGAVVWRAPFHTPPNVTMQATKLRAGEANAMWVEVQLLRGKLDDPQPLLGQIDNAVAEDPTWTDGDFWRSVILTYATKPDLSRIVGLLQAQVAKTPDHERARLGLVSSKMQELQEAAKVAGKKVTKGDLDPLQADVIALGKIARTSAALNEVAWYFALRGMPDVGLGFVRRSLSADPSCVGCMDTLAVILAETGRFDEAIEEEETAMGMISDRPASKDFASRIGELRRQKEQCREKPKSPGCAKTAQ